MPTIHRALFSRGNSPIPVSELVPNDFVHHVLQKISAGFPSPAADYVAEPLNIHDFLIGRPLATFIFAVAGDSLKNIGILDGDYLVVDRSIQERNGRIVLACVNGEFTAKRLRLLANGAVELHPENDAYQPITFKDGEVLEIFGVVISSFRRMVRT